MLLFFCNYQEIMPEIKQVPLDSITMEDEDDQPLSGTEDTSKDNSPAQQTITMDTRIITQVSQEERELTEKGAESSSGEEEEEEGEASDKEEGEAEEEKGDDKGEKDEEKEDGKERDESEKKGEILGYNMKNS